VDDDFRRACLESQLQTLGNWLDARDAVIIRAHEAGISKQRIHRITGVARTTINRITGTVPRPCPCCGKPRAEHSRPEAP
jgi:hypothetical protein